MFQLCVQKDRSASPTGGCCTPCPYVPGRSDVGRRFLPAWSG